MTTDSMKDLIRAQLEESARVKSVSARDFTDVIADAAQLLIACYQRGGKLIAAGNGGSAADAQHIAAELVGRFKKERRALPALALTANTSILTALGNDYGYDVIFSRQVEAYGAKGDVLLAISTSGNSPNIIAAVTRAKTMGIRTIAFTGRGGGALKGLTECAIVVPSQDTQRIQEAHITIGHILCDIVEQELFSEVL